MAEGKRMYLYIVRCTDGSLYTGVSSDIEKRIHRHNTGYYERCYTVNRRPVQLVFLAKFREFADAFYWEDRIKRWSHTKKEAFIRRDSEAMVKLTKKDFGRGKSAAEEPAAAIWPVTGARVRKQRIENSKGRFPSGAIIQHPLLEAA